MSHLQNIGSDVTRWNSFRKGDREAFAQLYDEHIQELLSYGYRVTSDRQLIRDSIQDMFLHLWTHRENLSETDSVRFYLFRSLRNRIVRNIEKESKSVSFYSEEAVDQIVGDYSFEDTLVQFETDQAQATRLDKAIRKLSKRQQEVILFRYHHDFSLGQIEQIMSLSNQSVRNLLHRSISQLRNIFEVGGWIIFLLSGL